MLGYGFHNIIIIILQHDLRRLLRLWLPCLLVCCSCLRDHTISRAHNTTRGTSLLEHNSVSCDGGGHTSSNSRRSNHIRTNLAVKVNGYGKCTTDVTDISCEKFLLQPSSNQSPCVYSKTSPVLD